LSERLIKPIKHWFLLIFLALIALQLYFLIRVATFALIDPASTSFERSEALRIASVNQHAEPTRLIPRLAWLQEWRSYGQISTHLKRAVIASEDDIFTVHNGVQWEAIQRAWSKNSNAIEVANINQRGGRKHIKIVGGSTITQQLAKNLFLSKERTLLRKAQELLITLELEMFLSKTRILEIYLNHVEWGAGVFGAQAAALHYYGHSAKQLSPNECARLAVMLPRPKYFERNLGSLYLMERSQVIESRMQSAKIPTL
jgi:monofunctional biosynthetic peptidoglycan transglycosylase